ncbi:hypothetical protein P0Y43_18480 [Pseudomonas entomophila]|uniref:hypothetical protein n=1 Tax=Pseudomonas entomophila TaxID=312306 RepID=UPI0023D82432|nr:hypothetical protein [Pseudomonas entomophila]MDF0732677.1 hypothetical protein [Pseudomonas entomophila]
MSWEKVGKALAGVLVVVAAGFALHALWKDDAKLEAHLSYEYLTYPSQFSERISQANDQLKYERLHAGIEAIAQGALGHEQVDKLVNLAQAPYLQLFAKPFEAGLVDHRTGLVISLHNHGDTPVKDVHIRLPARGLVQVRDDAGNDRIPEATTNLIDIPTITPGGACKVWVYFDADYSQIKQGGISIVHADGKADVQVLRQVMGFQALVARYAQVLVGLLVVLGGAVFVLGWRLRAVR